MENSIYDIEVTDIEKNTYKLERYRGNVMLIVNVASGCGLAEKSYRELSDLLIKFHTRGLRILLFPCRQFLNQEYEDLEQVREFSRQYHDEFVLMDAVNVKGTNIHPLFRYLTDNLKGFLFNGIKWNFTYFLVGRNGELVKRYGPTESITDTDASFLKCIGEAECPDSLQPAKKC